MSPSEAQEMFDRLVSQVKSAYSDDKVSEGQFGAMMDVSLVNDGPVTLMLDSKNRENRDPATLVDAASPAAAAQSEPTPSPSMEATPTP